MKSILKRIWRKKVNSDPVIKQQGNQKEFIEHLSDVDLSEGSLDDTEDEKNDSPRSDSSPDTSFEWICETDLPKEEGGGKFRRFKRRKSKKGSKAGQKPKARDEFVYVEDLKGMSKEEWDIILASSDAFTCADKRMRDSLRRGIPSEIRGDIWMYMLQLVPWSFPRGEYARLRDMKSSDETNILKDIGRTFPKNEYFHKEGPGQQRLLQVLRAYSNFDPDVGYCQGMAFLVAVLLLNIRDDDKVFWAFVQIMQLLRWRKIYIDGTPKLIKLINKLDRRIKRHLPEIHNHLEEHGLPIDGCFSQHIITLFLYDTPMEFANRVIDVFLVEGHRIILQVIIRLLVLKKDKILALKGNELWVYLKNEIVVECVCENEISSIILETSDFSDVEIICR